MIQNTERDINEGRWDPDEHMRFIEAINNYGNEWKEVQKYVGTRTSNQVRSHAQKFFLKLKTFSYPSIGIDFTLDSVKNLSSILNLIKELEKQNKTHNMLYILNQKLSERNAKMNNGIINQNENILFKNNKIIINNEFINENMNKSNFKEFIIKKENINLFKNNCLNKNEKKLLNSVKQKKIKK